MTDIPTCPRCNERPVTAWDIGTSREFVGALCYRCFNQRRRATEARGREFAAEYGLTVRVGMGAVHRLGRRGEWPASVYDIARQLSATTDDELRDRLGFGRKMLADIRAVIPYGERWTRFSDAPSQDWAEHAAMVALA